MTDISPGDEVTVTITGTVTELIGQYGFEMLLPDGVTYTTQWMRPNVKVTVLRPDRPTRREVLELHTPVMSLGGDSIPAIIGCRCEMPGLVRHGIQRTSYWHPEHLDAVLTKWEES